MVDWLDQAYAAEDPSATLTRTARDIPASAFALPQSWNDYLRNSGQALGQGLRQLRSDVDETVSPTAIAQRFHEGQSPNDPWGVTGAYAAFKNSPMVQNYKDVWEQTGIGKALPEDPQSLIEHVLRSRHADGGAVIDHALRIAKQYGGEFEGQQSYEGADYYNQMAQQEAQERAQQGPAYTSPAVLNAMRQAYMWGVGTPQAVQAQHYSPQQESQAALAMVGQPMASGGGRIPFQDGGWSDKLGQLMSNNPYAEAMRGIGNIAADQVKGMAEPYIQRDPIGVAMNLASAVHDPLYHGSMIPELKELTASSRGPLGPGVYTTPSEQIAKRYGDNVYRVPNEGLDVYRGAGYNTDQEYYGYKADKERLAKSVEPEMKDQILPLIDKMGHMDGYPLYQSIIRAYRSEDKGQDLFKRAGFHGISGLVDGPETLLFDKQKVAKAYGGAL
jgi:hypothetical protein